MSETDPTGTRETGQSAGEDWRGKVGRLAGDEVTAFLGEDHIARLACLDDNGWPYVVPCWHEWDGSSFWVVPRSRAAWARYLAAEPRCAITIDEAGTQRKVVAQARAVLVEEPCLNGKWLPIAERMSLRYLGEHGPEYLAPTLDKPRWLFRLDPVNITTWQGNDWAERYK
ncbi:pyridoxamine 5'-phosphate oxidase family protein [Actinomadura sp. 9N407]|uniref:pyridoxamine 5'-phosphate oxidase family protein n=1 Tax=Actinomadura sp. 9N407 TaxID=3375154 RepID=UPI0037AEDBD4